MNWKTINFENYISILVRFLTGRYEGSAKSMANDREVLQELDFP